MSAPLTKFTAKEIHVIISRLREGTIVWESKKLCLVLAKVTMANGLTSRGKPKKLTFYRCKHCSELFPMVEVEVDHIEPIGPFLGDWHIYISRMYCSIKNLQVLCVACHLAKTHLIDKVKIRLMKQYQTYDISKMYNNETAGQTPGLKEFQDDWDIEDL